MGAQFVSRFLHGQGRALALAALAGLLLPVAAHAQLADPLSEAPTIDRGRMDRLDPVVPAPTPQAETPRPRTQVAPDAVRADVSAQTMTGFIYKGFTLDRAILDALGRMP